MKVTKWGVLLVGLLGAASALAQQYPTRLVRYVDELGTRTNPMTPEQFADFVRAENAKYQKVVKQTNVRME